MFNSYEFSFDGLSSAMFNLMIYDFDGKGQSNVPFGNKAKIIETRTNNRIQPLHFGVNYHSSPLEFSLVFGSEVELDRYDLEAVSIWLTGHQDYKWLSIDQPDMDRVQFRCIISELTPLAHGWLPVAFEAHIICDCPYAYSFPFERTFSVHGETEVLFRNDSTIMEPLKPTITYVPTAGVTELHIRNLSDGGREFVLDKLPASDLNITVDNNNGIITEKNYGYNLYDGFNLKFFRLVHGDNRLVITGDGELTISGRFLYNVAG